MTNLQSKHRRKRSSKKTVYSALAFSIILMILAIVVLTFSSSIKNKKLTQTYNELNEVRTTYDELDTKYKAAIEELDYYIGESAEMNTLIGMQKTELEARRKEIAQLIGNRTELDKARSQIRELSDKVKTYVDEIQQLQNDRMILTSVNEELKNEKQELFSNMQDQLMVNEQLTEAKAVLVSQNEKLNRSVRRGSVVRVDDIEVKGLKVRPNGKVKEKKASRQVDDLKICFTATTNDVVDAGMEAFYVRIVNPRGETLAIEDLGSGYLTLENSGEGVRITSATEIKYDNEEQDICMIWSPNTTFAPGKYQVEVYNKGYLAGTGGFELK